METNSKVSKTKDEKPEEAPAKKVYPEHPDRWIVSESATVLVTELPADPKAPAGSPVTIRTDFKYDPTRKLI